MSSATSEPKNSPDSIQSAWLKKIGPLLGVALNAIAPPSATPLSASRTTSPGKRQVAGGGGYIFEQHADGKIFIVKSPKQAQCRIEVKDPKACKAILAEIGPFQPTNGPAAPAQPAPQPKVLEPVQQTAAGDTYRSQRDNPELGDTTCNVTSLAMQLISLAAGDEAKLRETAVQLLKARNVSASTDTQLEELLRQLAIKVAGGPTVTLGNDSTYDAWKVAYVLDGVSELFSDYVAKTNTVLNVASKEKFQDSIVPELEKGAAIMLSTKMTSSGHIVKLNEVRDDGILIDDPYGCLVEVQGGYLRNGEKLVQAKITRINDNGTILDQRLKSNSSLRKTLSDLAAAKTGNLPGNCGDDNFYSWDEVKTYSIGKWANITHKK